MKSNKTNIFARKFDMLEPVYNTKKNELQIVLAEIPYNKRNECGVPKMKRAYICTKPKSDVWTIELSEDLRPATIFERV
jgi:hypothetical protein